MLEPVPGLPAERGQRPRPLLRTTLGEVLRRARLAQRRTLADVARAAKVSMPYLSEVERGRKEVSSEVLAAICESLRVDLAEVLAEAGRTLARRDRARRLHVIGESATWLRPVRTDSPQAESDGADVAGLADGADLAGPPDGADVAGLADGANVAGPAGPEAISGRVASLGGNSSHLGRPQHSGPTSARCLLAA